MIPSPSLLTTHVLMLTNQMFGGGSKLDLLWHFYLDPLPEGRTDLLKLRPGCSFPANAPSPRHHICFRKIFSPSELQADGKNFPKHFQTWFEFQGNIYVSKSEWTISYFKFSVTSVHLSDSLLCWWLILLEWHSPLCNCTGGQQI